MEKISQIVKLKQMMRRWRALIRRPTRSGYATVYVGSDRRRFEIPVRYLNFPVIAGLLEKAEEEFGGAQPAGGLSLPCEPVFFLWVIGLLDRDEARFRGLGLEGFTRLFADCSNPMADMRRSQSFPLLQSARVSG